MRPSSPDDHLICRMCGHEKQDHMMVCGKQECDCLCFLPSSDQDYERLTGTPWQETLLFSVLDLILHEQEGDIYIKMKDGRECHVKVEYCNIVGPTITRVKIS